MFQFTAEVRLVLLFIPAFAFDDVEEEQNGKACHDEGSL